MIIPAYINARWIDGLGDEQLLQAEAELHAVFDEQQTTEKARRGDRYILMQGPETLVTAWHRWLQLNNATRRRGLVIRRHARG